MVELIFLIVVIGMFIVVLIPAIHRAHAVAQAGR